LRLRGAPKRRYGATVPACFKLKGIKKWRQARCLSYIQSVTRFTSFFVKTMIFSGLFVTDGCIFSERNVFCLRAMGEMKILANRSSFQAGRWFIIDQPVCIRYNLVTSLGRFSGVPRSVGRIFVQKTARQK
jgi:hypothetical protein